MALCVSSVREDRSIGLERVINYFAATNYLFYNIPLYTNVSLSLS
jgi:hypothetical protein